MKFADLKAKVLKILGIEKFPVKDGKHELTEEQTAKLEGIEKGFAKKLIVALDRELKVTSQESAEIAELRENISVLELSNSALEKEVVDKTEQVEKLVNMPEPDKVLENASGIKLISKRKIDMSKPINIAALKASKGDLEAINNFMSKVSAGQIDISEILADANFDTFYNQEVSRDIAKTLSFGFESQSFFTTQRAVEMYRAAKGTFTEVVQPFIGKWTPKGAGAFTPITIMNRRHKINVEFTPSDIEGYLFYLYDEAVEPAQMPISKYLYEKQIKPQIFNDIEIQMLGNGVYKAPAGTINTNDPGLPAKDGMDGIPEILNQLYDKSGNNVNWIADTSAWVIGTAETLAKKYQTAILNTPYAMVPMELCVSPENKQAYIDDIRNKYRMSIKDMDVDLKLPESNISIVSKPFLIGHNDIKFLTPKSNRILLRHKNEPDKLRIADDKKYDVFVIGEFWLAAGFAIEEEIWAGVPNSSASGSGS